MFVHAYSHHIYSELTMLSNDVDYITQIQLFVLTFPHFHINRILHIGYILLPHQRDHRFTVKILVKLIVVAFLGSMVAVGGLLIKS